MLKQVQHDRKDDINAAIRREKQIKGWLRKKKVALVETINPEWKDLSEGAKRPKNLKRRIQS